jgi:hypothetical protein
MKLNQVEQAFFVASLKSNAPILCDAYNISLNINFEVMLTKTKQVLSWETEMTILT